MSGGSVVHEWNQNIVDLLLSLSRQRTLLHDGLFDRDLNVEASTTLVAEAVRWSAALLLSWLDYRIAPSSTYRTALYDRSMIRLRRNVLRRLRG